MSNGLEYRRLVASIARQLSAEERQQVAYIRLEKEDISKFSLQSRDVTGIDLFAKLERLGVFSQTNIDGLVGIVAKDVNRSDLVDEIGVYKKNIGVYKKNAKKFASKQTKKRPKKATTPSAERRELEGAFEMLVVKMSVLEQYLSMLQRTLDGEGNIQDEGTEIIRFISDSVQGLASDLHAAHQKLAPRLRRSSSESSLDSKRSTSGSSIESENYPNSPMQSLNTSAKPNRGPLRPQSKTLAASTGTELETLGIRARDILPQPLPPFGSRNQETAVTSAVNPPHSPKPKPKPKKNNNHLFPQRTSGDVDKKNPPPTSPKPKRAYTRPEKEEEEEDRTGDSGMGSGSGYSTVEEFRSGITQPPPEPRSRHVHSTKPEERKVEPSTLNEDNLYEEIPKGLKAVPNYNEATTDEDDGYQVIREDIAGTEPISYHRYQPISKENKDDDCLYEEPRQFCNPPPALTYKHNMHA